LAGGLGADGMDCIEIVGAREHNLRDVSVRLPRNRLVVVTGLSGSGKSSLAFDTVYVEGQRRYVESLSAYARQFLQIAQKPAVERITGLPPTIAIEQAKSHANPRSTVGTATEIYDYLRLLYARAGKPHCPRCRRPIDRQTPQQIVDGLLAGHEGRRAMLLAPVVRGRKGEHREALARMRRDGFVRARVDGELVELQGLDELPDKRRKHTVEAVVDRLVLRADQRGRLAESVETALRLGGGLFVSSVEDGGTWTDGLHSAKFGCPECNVSFPEMEPRLFSFNAPYGACPSCDGLGAQLSLDPDLVVPDPSLSLADGAVDPARRGGMMLQVQYAREVREFVRRYKANPQAPYGKLPKLQRDILLYGDPDARQSPARDRDDVTDEREPEHGPGFAGIIPQMERQFRHTQSEFLKHRIHAYMAERSCPGCGGLRLREEARAVTFAGKNICEFTALSTRAALEFTGSLSLEGEAGTIAQPILREIGQRLAFMSDVGLDYLTLDRATGGLSGGENQRIRLASQASSGLAGV